MSRYAQIEQDNNQHFSNLANKLSQFREISQDIQNISNQDHSLITGLQDNLESLYDSIKKTGGRLTEVLQNNRFGVWKLVGLGLVIFFVLYTLWKLI
ncbi:hypothetical protein WICMUC_005556 [Wickerhamomyces mucosus]|uniref:t-SNARE coiled-coil homology domain-containing protein n=1 Tax=Wickerhamomyces mucosus TaxID=1378264 RepID=A0A9P8P7C5_9ASCO|nr:hypothetical protein WICMUC_005556 [Wickerhamomyces mucosus]